jgi:hypothetical protein
MAIDVCRKYILTISETAKILPSRQAGNSLLSGVRLATFQVDTAK